MNEPNLLRPEILRHCRQAPVRHGWHAGGEIPVDRAPLQEEPEHGTQGGHHKLRPAGAHLMGMPEHKRRDVPGSQRSELQRPVAEALGQKPPEKPAVVRQGGRRESPLGRQVALVLALQQAEGRLVDHRNGWARDAAATQVREKAPDRGGLAAVHAGPPHAGAEKPVEDPARSGR
jgi:hypothetical protein